MHTNSFGKTENETHFVTLSTPKFLKNRYLMKYQVSKCNILRFKSVISDGLKWYLSKNHSHLLKIQLKNVKRFSVKILFGYRNDVRAKP